MSKTKIIASAGSIIISGALASTPADAARDIIATEPADTLEIFGGENFGIDVIPTGEVEDDLWDAQDLDMQLLAQTIYAGGGGDVIDRSGSGTKLPSITPQVGNRPISGTGSNRINPGKQLQTGNQRNRNSGAPLKQRKIRKKKN